MNGIYVAAGALIGAGSLGWAHQPEWGLAILGGSILVLWAGLTEFWNPRR
jgi:hypothetical protein